MVGLAGKRVNCRYTARNRAEILRSRVSTTRAVSLGIAAAAEPPAVWVNSSTATIYRHAKDRPITEDSGEIGSGFSVDVATAWEGSLTTDALPGRHTCAGRLAAQDAQRGPRHGADPVSEYDL